jgi:hypothetical protein
MRTLVIMLLALPGCADPPTAAVRFAPFDGIDNCDASEREILSGTSAVWIGLRDETGLTVADRCLEVGELTWDGLEERLVGADLLIEDLPLTVPLELFVMGIPAPGDCPPGDPGGGVRFCGESTESIIIRPEGGGEVVEVERRCPATYTAQQCFGGT